MGYIPFNYEQINIAAGTYNPSPVKAYNNQTFAFWERALFQRALSVLDITLPDDWNGSIKDLFNYILFRNGFVVVFNDSKYGNIFSFGSLKGYDVFYRPTNAIVCNPILGSRDMVIGKECGILKLTPDYFGIWDIITYYAEKLSTLDNAINMSLINNKFAFILAAKNKAAGEALKKMLDKVNKGEPAVIVDQKLNSGPKDDSEPWQYWDRGNLKESYLTTDQLNDFRTLLYNFDSEIGIPTLRSEKKERMITDEAIGLQRDAVSRSEIWIDTFNESAIAVNELFGLNISAKRKEIPGGGAEDELSESNNDRPL